MDYAHVSRLPPGLRHNELKRFFFPGVWGFARQPGVWHFIPYITFCKCASSMPCTQLALHSASFAPSFAPLPLHSVVAVCCIFATLCIDNLHPWTFVTSTVLCILLPCVQQTLPHHIALKGQDGLSIIPRSIHILYSLTRKHRLPTRNYFLILALYHDI